MTAPLRLIDRSPALSGGRDAILARARALWAEKPAGATMTAKARAKYAVAIILEAIQDNLRPALVDLIDNHCQGVEDAYVLYEGDTPEDGDISQPALDWWHGFYAAQDEALSGDVEKRRKKLSKRQT